MKQKLEIQDGEKKSQGLVNPGSFAKPIQSFCANFNLF
jgi:hypothetical protein